MAHKLDQFIDAFQYRRKDGIEKWSFIANDDPPRGDCESFARTVAQLWAHGKAAMLEGMKSPRRKIKFYLCWSPRNDWVPRHTIVWIRGRGYIDSTRREWRDEPHPHKIAWRWPNWTVRMFL